MNPLIIIDIHQAITRHCRENNQSWLGRWEDRPWLTLELGRRQAEELDQIAFEGSKNDIVHDGRSWCESNRIKVKALDVDDHFALVA